MSDIDLKALRDEAEFQKICGRSDWPRGTSISGNDMITLLDRLESAERRAEEAEKERDAQRKDAAEFNLAWSGLIRDAARYLWLRKGLPYRVEATEGKAIYLVSLRPESGYADALDAALDTAMAQEGGK